MKNMKLSDQNSQLACMIDEFMIEVDISGHPPFPLNHHFRARGFDKP
jgi:hypothetical protein